MIKEFFALLASLAAIGTFVLEILREIRSRTESAKKGRNKKH